MAKVAVRIRDQAKPMPGGVLEYFGDGHSIHLHSHTLAAGAELELPSLPVDRMLYVLAGAVTVAGRELAEGSAIVVERAASGHVVGRAKQSELLCFEAAQPSRNSREGGHVHLLPHDQVPHVALLGASGVGGSIFADGQCATCEVWLHENRFPPLQQPPADPQAGVHSHEEDEIIFVTRGEMQLGNRRVGRGTAIAIAAGTLYSFLPGPNGLTFINFRAGHPGQIHFADGRTADEVAVWRGVDRPLRYIAA